MKDSGSFGRAMAGLFIGGGLTLGAYFTATSFKAIKLANQTLTVKGYSEKNVTSDFAKWEGVLHSTDSTRQEVYQKLLEGKAKVAEFLKSKGLREKDFSFGIVHIYDRYKVSSTGIQTNEIEDYSGNLSVKFESDDVGKVAKIAQDANELIKTGLNFESYSPNYFYRKLDEVKIDLLGDAAKDAKDRAQELAKNVGSKVGALRDARQGVFQITSRNDPSVSSHGIFDTSSVDKTVKAVVTMSFVIK